MEKAVAFGLLFVVLMMTFGVSGVALADRSLSVEHTTPFDTETDDDGAISGETVNGDVEVDGDIVVTDGSKIKGDVEAGGDTTISDSRVDGDLEAEGDAAVTDGSRINGDVEAEGDTTISDSRVDGDVGTEGSARTSGGIVNGDIDTEGTVELADRSRIKGDVDAEGDVVISKHSEVDGEIDADGDVIHEDEQAAPELSALNIAGQRAEARITEGDGEDVSVVVENVGTADGTFEVTVAVGDWTDTRATGTIASGDSGTVSFESITGDLDPGSYDVTVSTGDETVSGNLVVQTDQEPAFFEVGITGRNSAVTAGETLTVDMTITNTGEEEATQTVELGVETLGTDSKSLTLGGGVSTTERFAIGTGTDDAGKYTATVWTENDSDSAQVTVDQARSESDLSEVTIAGQGAEATITEGDGGDVSVTVENVGDASGSFDVTLTVGETLGVTKNTDELTAGESEIVTFPNVTDGLVAEGYTVDISTASDTVTGTLEIQTDQQEDTPEETPENTPEDTPEDTPEETPENTPEDTPEETPENTPEDTPEETPENTPEDTPENTPEEIPEDTPEETPENTPEDTPEETPENTPEDTPENTPEATPEATPENTPENDREETFEISMASLSNTVITAGESLEIGLQVENVAERNDTFDADLLVDGETVDSEPVTIEAGGTETVAFSYQFDDPGEYEIAVGDRPLNTLTVTAAAEDKSEMERNDDATAIEIEQATVPADWVGEGYETSVRVTVKNTANRTANRTLTVTVDNQSVADETVTLQPHERDELTLKFGATGGSVAVEDVDAGWIDTGEAYVEEDIVGEDTGGGDTEESAGFESDVGIVAFLVIVGILAGVAILKPR